MCINSICVYKYVEKANLLLWFHKKNVGTLPSLATQDFICHSNTTFETTIINQLHVQLASDA